MSETTKTTQKAQTKPSQKTVKQAVKRIKKSGPLHRVLNKQQESFLYYYTNPKSPTFGNATQSGLKAGYSQEYSESITYQLPDWLSENLGDMRRLQKAERNLEEVQSIPTFDGEGKPIDANLLGHRIKVDQFFAKTLGKDKYAERKELTGKDGKDLPTNTVNAIVSSILNE